MTEETVPYKTATDKKRQFAIQQSMASFSDLLFDFPESLDYCDMKICLNQTISLLAYLIDPLNSYVRDTKASEYQEYSDCMDACLTNLGGNHSYHTHGDPGRSNNSNSEIHRLVAASRNLNVEKRQSFPVEAPRPALNPEALPEQSALWPPPRVNPFARGLSYQQIRPTQELVEPEPPSGNEMYYPRQYTYGNDETMQAPVAPTGYQPPQRVTRYPVGRPLFQQGVGAGVGHTHPVHIDTRPQVLHPHPCYLPPASRVNHEAYRPSVQHEVPQRPISPPVPHQYGLQPCNIPERSSNAFTSRQWQDRRGSRMQSELREPTLAQVQQSMKGKLRTGMFEFKKNHLPIRPPRQALFGSRPPADETIEKRSYYLKK